MFCHKCGTQIIEDSAFCPKCGEMLIKDEAASQASFASEGETSSFTNVANPVLTRPRLPGRLLIGIAVAVVLIIVVIVAVTSSGGVDDDQYIQMVKGGTLDGYPQMTVGDAFDNFLSDPEWESGVSEDGETIVNVTGQAFYLDEEADFAVQFIVNEDDETFVYNALEINGLPQIDLIYWGLLDSVYSEESVSAAASLDTSGASSSGNRIEIGETQSYNVEGFGNMEVTLDYVEFVDRIENEMHELNPNLIPEYTFPDEGNIFLRASLTMYNIGTENASLMTAWTTIIYDDTYQFNSYSLDGATLDSISPLTPPTTGTIIFEVGSVVAESDGSLVLDFGNMTGETVMSFTIRPGTGDSAGQGVSGGSEAGTLTADEAQALLLEWVDSHPVMEEFVVDTNYYEETVNGGEYYGFPIVVLYDEADGGGSELVTTVLVDKSTGEMLSYNAYTEEILPLDEWYNINYFRRVNTGGDNLNMRIAPGPSFEVIGQIPNGEVVEVIGFEGEWASVMYDDYNGWVAQEYLGLIQ